MTSEDSKTISELDKKVKKYESKIRDLIEAYKCMSKEKETLEKTVESFSRQKKVLSNNVAASNQEGSSEIERLQLELAALSISIASLTEERRRMERSYLDDKRVMRAEYETNLKAIRSELESQNIENESLRAKIKKKNINMEKVDENLIERDYQVAALNDECARLRLELSATLHERSQEKNSHEFRVAQLEDTIADISKNIGLMEKQHVSDTETIVKLTERVQNLLSESRISTKTQSDTPDILQFQECDKSCATTTIQAIVERMTRLRVQLQEMDPGLDLVSIVGGDGGMCGGACEARIRQMKDDLECAQMKVDGALRSTMTSSIYQCYQQQDWDKLNEELLMTKDKVALLQDELSSMDAVALQREMTLRDALARNERSHKQEITRLRQEHGQVVAELQSEFTKHRNRTIGLLAEKEAEIHGLQRQVHRRSGGADTTESEVDPGLNDATEFSHTKYDSSCPLYQCCEIKARMDHELRRVKQQRRQLEAQVHKLEAENEYRVNDWTQELNGMRTRLVEAESVSRLDSNINLEYLRNVFIRFLTSEDASCKWLMAKAIGKVLHIGAKDLSVVERCLGH